MFANHDALTNREDAEFNRDQRKVLTLRPLLTDREVPLHAAVDTPKGEMSDVVQRWLDGDLSERLARRADDESVEFWNTIAMETRRRSRMETPAYMSGRIMAVLPRKTSRTEMLFRKFKMKTTTAIVSAAALVAAGVAVGEWLLH